VLGYTHFHYQLNVLFSLLFLYFIAFKNSFFKHKKVLEGDTTLNIMTLSIMTLSLMVKQQHSALHLYCAEACQIYN